MGLALTQQLHKSCFYFKDPSTVEGREVLEIYVAGQLSLGSQSDTDGLSSPFATLLHCFRK